MVFHPNAGSNTVIVSNWVMIRVLYGRRRVRLDTIRSFLGEILQATFNMLIKFHGMNGYAVAKCFLFNLGVCAFPNSYSLQRFSPPSIVSASSESVPAANSIRGMTL